MRDRILVALYFVCFFLEGKKKSRAEGKTTFCGLWSLSSCLRPLMRSGVTWTVTVTRNTLRVTSLTVSVVVILEDTTTVPPNTLMKESVTFSKLTESTTESTRETDFFTVPSVRVPQGRSTMSALVFKVVSVGVGELNVLAPISLRARTLLRNDQCDCLS